MEPHTTRVVYCRLIPAFKGIPRIPQEETVPPMEFGAYEGTFSSPIQSFPL